MPALAFVAEYQDAVYGAEYVATSETVHGLLVLEGHEVLIQWRVAREHARYGTEIRTDREVEPVRELRIPVTALASVTVRESRLPWKRTDIVIVTAADLRAFEPIATLGGLRLSHPAELTLVTRKADRGAAHTFSAELEMALAQQALTRAETAALPHRSLETR